MARFTKRQAKLLAALFDHEDGVSVASLEKQLQVSRRTIYREFRDLRLYLAGLNLEIVNESSRYRLVGDAEAQKSLRSELFDSVMPSELSAPKRRNALAVMLLLSPDYEKSFYFADKLSVSETTIQTDLEKLAPALAPYKLQIVRKKGVGIAISGSETRIRRMACEILLNQINDYNFLRYCKQEIAPESADYFLNLLSQDHLAKVYQAAKATIIPKIKVGSDRQLTQLILTFGIARLRTSQNRNLPAGKMHDGSLKYQGLVYQFAAADDEVEYTRNDVIYLGNFLNSLVLNPIESDYFSEGEMEIVIQLKEFVRAVSEEVGYNFQRNPLFFDRLVQHVVQLLTRHSEVAYDPKTPALEELMHKYPELYRVLEEKWALAFPNDPLTEAQMQLILLYFANEYVKKAGEQAYQVLVVCENGIGTSEILKTRLKKEFSAIGKIVVSKVSEMEGLDLDAFDLILSTLKLPGFARKYLLVSPLLLQNEIKQIQTALDQLAEPHHQHELSYANPERKLKLLAQSASFAQDLLNRCQLFLAQKGTETLEGAAQDLVFHLSSQVVRHQQSVADALVKRAELAPIGIPETNLALLHTQNSDVNRCYFAVLDLSQAIAMDAMDGSQCQVTRMLVMLAPSQMADWERQVLSTVSSTVVVSDENTEIFAKGSLADIKRLLASTFLRQLKQM